MDLFLGFVELAAGLTIGAGIVAGFVWLLPRLRIPVCIDRTRARETMMRVRESIAWAALADGPEPVLVLERRGYRGRVEVRGGKNPATDVTYELGGGVNGWLQVATESVAHGMIKTFGVQDLVIGDKDFDDAHEISAESEEFARRVLDADARSMLRSIGARADFVFRVTPGTLLLRVNRVLYDANALETLIVTATNLFGALELPERGSVRVEEVQTAAADAQCEICGAKLSLGDVVRCARCDTPHHRDCWEFNGVCSTFACGSRQTKNQESRTKNQG